MTPFSHDTLKLSRRFVHRHLRASLVAQQQEQPQDEVRRLDPASLEDVFPEIIGTQFAPPLRGLVTRHHLGIAVAHHASL